MIENKITNDHEFMILACDGIWDVLSSQEVIDFIRARIGQGMEPDVVSGVFYTIQFKLYILWALSPIGLHIIYVQIYMCLKEK